MRGCVAAWSVLSLPKVLPGEKPCGVRRRQLARGSVRACASACMHACASTCVCVQAHVCKCVCKRVCVRACASVCMCKHVCACAPCAGNFRLRDYSQQPYSSWPSKLEATEMFFNR